MPSRFWRASGNALLPGRNILGPAASAWTPASLGSALVAWYDFSDLSTLFQDDAGTTAVTASGQAIGKILDKSGNARHLTQSTAANKPVYTTGSGLAWGAFDGTNDALVSASGQSVIDASGQWSWGAAILPSVASATKIAIGCERFGSIGRLGISDGSGVARAYALAWPTPAEDYGNTVSAGTAKVVTAIAKTTTLEAFLDGATNGTTAVTALQASSQTTTITLGGTNDTSDLFNGPIYAGVMVNRPLTAGEHSSLVTYLGSKCGLVL